MIELSSKFKSIVPVELQMLQASGVVEVVDVRTAMEFQEVHAAVVSSNVPLDSLDPVAVMYQRKLANKEPLYVICRSGNRSRIACEMFHAAGYKNVVNIEGGTVAWEAAGYPVTRGAASVSLERQVRMLAGSLVVIGILLAWLVHPAFVLLSAFVGAGLVFAGATDTCGMGILLARMPWNQVRDDSCSRLSEGLDNATQSAIYSGTGDKLIHHRG